MLYIFCKRKIRTAKHGSGLSNAGQSPKRKDGQNKKRKLAATEGNAPCDLQEAA